MPPRLLFSSLLLLSTACQPALVPMSAAPVPATEPRAASPDDATRTMVIADAGRDFPAYRYLRTRQLMVPVLGKTILDVEDTFDHARSGQRVHRAVDIRAPRGTPVVAADDGEVIAVRENALGGRIVYCTDPDQRVVYYYAHLDRYADGLAVGRRVRQGDVIGYVGTTGNAPPDVPHLHFQVMELADRKRYWDNPVLDPRPYFTRDGATAGGR